MLIKLLSVPQIQHKVRRLLPMVSQLQGKSSEPKTMLLSKTDVIITALFALRSSREDLIGIVLLLKLLMKSKK